MKAGTYWLIGCSMVLAFTAACLFFLFLAVSTVTDGGDFSFGTGNIGVVNIIGEISDSRDVVEELERHARDGNVAAVVLRIDSPGGGVAPSQEIHDAVLRLRAAKPVVASIGNMAASGGYYVAVAADSIVANPGSLTGSIGVIFSYLTAEELMRKVGVELEVMKSGPVKDVGSFHRKPTEGERAMLEGVVNDAYDQFVDAVAAGRDMDRDSVIDLADGRIYSGRQAVENGMVDALGGLHEAILMAADMGGVRGEPKVVSKERRSLRLGDFLREAVRLAAPHAASPALEYRLR